MSPSETLRYLSPRGRNLFFINRLGAILGLDRPGRMSAAQYKAAFTPKAVREIYEAVLQSWPENLDIKAIVRPEPGRVAGLYFGDYETDYVLRGVVRHSTYADKILLVDPFMYPVHIRDQYNPLVHPEQHRAQALKHVNFWFALLPWIEEGIVEIIRGPDDFVPGFFLNTREERRTRFKNDPVLQEALKKTTEELKARHMHKMAKHHLLYAMPESGLRHHYEKLHTATGSAPLSFDEFYDYVKQQRDSDPDFLEQMGPTNSQQFMTFTSGATFDSACVISEWTGSYLLTDLHAAWTEISHGRTGLASVEAWSPFAKAVQESQFSYLDAVRLEDALTLRKEGRLSGMRNFMHQVWREACLPNEYAAGNALIFGERLSEELRKAQEEWRQIDKDLSIMATAEAAALLAAGPAILTGGAGFLAAAVVVAGAAALGNAASRRSQFPHKYPAAFFMNL